VAVASAFSRLLGVEASTVSIGAVTDTSSARRRRRMAAVAADVAFEVAAPSYSAARALHASVGALDPNALLAALQQSNAALAGVTLVAVSAPSLVAQVVSPPAPAPPGAPPPVLLPLRVTPRASGVDPSGRVTLSATVNSTAPRTLALAWSVLSLPPLDLRDASKIGTPLDTPTLGLLPGALQPGVTYTFTLRARDANGAAEASADVSVMAVPTGGALAASSLTGTALETRFALTTAGWTDGNADSDGNGVGDGYPLQYAFSYSVDGSVRNNARCAAARGTRDRLLMHAFAGLRPNRVCRFCWQTSATPPACPTCCCRQATTSCCRWRHATR
jgi:hypothetical protein